MNKTRIRSKKELNERKAIFFEIIKILKKRDIPLFLQGGILLGAKREKNFIKWDWDVEISVFAKDLLRSYKQITSDLKKKNFQIKTLNHAMFNPKIEFFKKNHNATSFSILGWHYSFFRQAYTRKKLKIPLKFMKKMGKIKFFKQTFLCPSPIDEYLEHQYGNWKMPIRTSNKSKYLSDKFYQKNFSFFDFLNSLFNLIHKFFLK
jgi:phosphorylcholine metabolism protein LicD